MAKCCGQESYGVERPRNDRRLQLIDDIKQLIGDIDSAERGKGVVGRKSGGRQIPGVRNMDEECLLYRKRRDCSPPTITSIAIHETRPTSMYDSMKYENSKQVTFVDATKGNDPYDPMPPAPWELPRTPSQELRAGSLYMSCDCRKRNGLQQDCPRWECGGRPNCMAVNPGPCCEPSKARKPVRGDRRQPSHPYGQPNYGAKNVFGEPNESAGEGKRFMSGTNEPPGGTKDSSTMVCLCEPMGACKMPRPDAPQARQESPQAPGIGVVGIVAVASSRPTTGQGLQGQGCGQGQGLQGQSYGQGQGLQGQGYRQAPISGMVCLCQTVGGTPGAVPSLPPPPQPRQATPMPPAGPRFMCCPMPS